MLFTEEKLKGVPALYSQDGKGDKAVVHLVASLGANNEYCWLLTEYSEEDEVFFGYVCLNDPQCAELGYVSLYELEKLGKEYPVKVEVVNMELKDAKAKYIHK
ncbi:hypothetical protein ALC152_04950 [Arcobacter sp. 15-2]|uniref:DUF2958 domain-containing protein n=1 Tax=Arcobacter sp. 15-2 TaxID=3374109 RepID=UPI00399CB865